MTILEAMQSWNVKRGKKLSIQVLLINFYFQLFLSVFFLKLFLLAGFFFLSLHSHEKFMKYFHSLCDLRPKPFNYFIIIIHCFDSLVKTIVCFYFTEYERNQRLNSFKTNRYFGIFKRQFLFTEYGKYMQNRYRNNQLIE